MFYRIVSRDINSDFNDGFVSTGEYFLIKENAEAYVQNQNQKLISLKNDAIKKAHQKLMKRWVEEKVLWEAGLRPEEPREPQLQLATELDLWDPELRIEEVKFQDEGG